jgi:hypothetical protein
MPDACETFVRWYLRFNGYLGVENFVVHEPRAGRVNQGTESDILAVRFPYSHEDPGTPLQLDPRLQAGMPNAPVVDFVIAEVKGGNRAPLNDVWSPPPSDIKIGRVAYLVKWLGSLPCETSIKEVATELQRYHKACRNGYNFRLIFFSKRERRPAQSLGIPQITFSQIAEFFVNVRAGCWQRSGLGVRSDHHQWDPLIRKAWSLADPGRGVSADQKVRDIAALLEGSLAKA